MSGILIDLCLPTADTVGLHFIWGLACCTLGRRNTTSSIAIRLFLSKLFLSCCYRQRNRIFARKIAHYTWLCTCLVIIMLPPLGIKRWCASDVCLSVAYIGPKSRTERPRKTKIGTEVSHVTRDSDTTFNVKRSKVNFQGRRHIMAASRTACLQYSGHGLQEKMSMLPNHWDKANTVAQWMRSAKDVS